MSKKIIILLAFTSFIYLMLYSCGVLFDAPKLNSVCCTFDPSDN
jgi:hypothetical protein